MNLDKKSTILICVTAQNACDRLIKVGSDIAKSFDYNIHILMVRPQVSDYAPMSNEIEYLYQTAKDYNGEMTIIFDNDAVKTAVNFAKKINAKRLVTGMPDGRLNGFIVRFHDAMPNLPISMVAKDNTIYNMDKQNTTA